MAGKLQKKQNTRGDTFQTVQWPYLHYLLISPKTGIDPNMLNVPSTPHSQWHSLKLTVQDKFIQKYSQTSILKELFKNKPEDILSFL